MYSTDDSVLLDKFTIDFCKIVEKHCSYVIVSGYLAISSGRVRGTEDIDIILPKLSIDEFKELHKDLLSKFSILTVEDDDIDTAYGYLIDSNLRYVYKDSVVPNMEVKFAKNIIDVDNLQNRIKIPLTGLDIYFAPIECAILYKEQYLGSEKDLEDARHLRKVFTEEISETKINKYKELIKQLL